MTTQIDYARLADKLAPYLLRYLRTNTASAASAPSGLIPHDWNGPAHTGVPDTFPPDVHDHDSSYVLKSTYDANTILKADTDDTPVALTVGASTIVGRGPTGGIAALSASDARDVLGLATDDNVAFGTVSATGEIYADNTAVAAEGLNARLEAISGDKATAALAYNPTQIIVPRATWALGNAGRDDFLQNNIGTNGTQQWQVAQAGSPAVDCTPYPSNVGTIIPSNLALLGNNASTGGTHAILREDVSGVTFGSTTRLWVRMEGFCSTYNHRIGCVVAQSDLKKAVAWWMVWDASSIKQNLIYAYYDSADAWLSQANSENSSVAWTTDWTVAWTSVDLQPHEIGAQTFTFLQNTSVARGELRSTTNQPSTVASLASGMRFAPAWCYLFVEKVGTNITRGFFDWVSTGISIP